MQLLPTKLLSTLQPYTSKLSTWPLLSSDPCLYNSKKLSKKKKKRKYSWHKSLPPPTPRMHSLAYRMMWKLLRMAIKIFLIHLELFLTPDLPHRSLPQGLFPRAVHRLREERARQERKTVLTDMCLRHTGGHRHLTLGPRILASLELGFEGLTEVAWKNHLSRTSCTSYLTAMYFLLPSEE